jgi:hypothetical protein
VSILADFLQAKEPLFDHALKELEEKTGKHGVDAKLAAEIASKAAQRIKQFGLPPMVDAETLYRLLTSYVKVQDGHLAQALGGTDPDDVRQMVPLIVKKAGELDMPKRGFFIKPEVAADLIKKLPPKQIMKRLGYTKVDAMLAKEDIYEIYVALRFAEDADWLTDFDKHTRKLVPADFETRDIKLVPFDEAKWGDVAKDFISHKLHNITNSKEMGVIAVMPMGIERMPGITLKDLPLIIHYYNEIRLYSSFFKLMRTKKNFGEIIADTLIADPSHVKITAGHNVHWRVIQRYFGKLPPEQHPEIFEPHLQPEDLHWRRAEEVLYDIDPDLEFWDGMDYVAVMREGGKAVTFNLMDVSLSYSNQIPFETRYLYHFRESLWNEVFARYMGQKTLRDLLLTRLDNAVIAPERL